MKCSGDSEILHELVRDNTQKSEKLKLIREVQYHELIRAVLPRIPASLHFLLNSVSIIFLYWYLVNVHFTLLAQKVFYFLDIIFILLVTGL